MKYRPTLLFVDDEVRCVRLLSMTFRGPYNVLSALSGHAALQIIRQQHVHVIVTDQRMPNMTGIELLAAVQKISPHTTRLLLTGFWDLAAVSEAVNDCDIYRYINKPWDQDELKAVITEAVALALSTETSLRGATAEAKQRPTLSLVAGSDVMLLDPSNITTRSPRTGAESASVIPVATQSISE